GDVDRLALAHLRAVDDDRLTHDAVERDVGGGDAVRVAVQRGVDVAPRVQALGHGGDLPEPRAPVVARELDAQVGRGRAHGVLVHGHGEIDDVLAHRTPVRRWWCGLVG